MHARSAFLSGILAVAALAPATGAAPAQTPTLAQYEALVMSYREGRDSPIDSLAQWSHGELDDVLAKVDGPFDQLSPWKPEYLTAAAMLHTDVALRQLKDRDAGETLYHIEHASRLLTRRRDRLRDFESRWYQAVAQRLRLGGFLLQTERLLETARQRVPDDPRILHESGITAEQITAASDYEGGGHYDRLAPAATFLRSALRAGSTDPQTTLHLAHVLQLQGAHDEPLALVDALSRQTTDPLVAYLAALIGGALLERSGDLDGAARRYVDARRRFPLGPFAYVALSEALQRDGRAEDAALVLRQLMTIDPVPGPREPWWWYVMEPAEKLVAMLDALRREARS
jgi:tetratricopeptide (TPR) repeat protein